MKLTLAQQRALDKLRGDVPSATAAYLGCSVAMLESLRRDCLVGIDFRIGNGTIPRHDIYWRALLKKE